MSRWLSLCCGFDAVASLAMTGRFVPIGRMGSKRAYAEQVLHMIGTWPTEFLMIDACPAIVSFWAFAFAGRLPEVAEIIRGYELDGEDLWRAIVAAPVPVDPVERLAAFIVAQKGNFSGKPVTWTAYGWKTDGSRGQVTERQRAKGFREYVLIGPTADKIAAWSGVAGYGGQEHEGMNDRPNGQWLRKDLAAGRINGYSTSNGSALRLDLATSSPVFSPGDLVTIDPPYVGTEGYGRAKLTRETVCCLAEIANATGCRVIVHEAEPVLDGGPWRSVELKRKNDQDTWRRRGKHGRKEFVTLNFDPAARVIAGSRLGAGRRNDGGTLPLW